MNVTGTRTHLQQRAFFFFFNYFVDHGGKARGFVDHGDNISGFVDHSDKTSRFVRYFFQYRHFWLISACSSFHARNRNLISKARFVHFARSLFA